MKFCKLASLATVLVLSANANAITTGTFEGYLDVFDDDGSAVSPDPTYWPVNATIDFTHTGNFENATGTGNPDFLVPFFGLPISSHDTSWTLNYDGTISLSTLLDWNTITNEPLNLVMNVTPSSCNSTESLDICVFNVAGIDDNGDGIPGNLWHGAFGGANFSLSGSLTMVSDESNIVNASMFNPVPVPAAVWLFGSGLIGLIGAARRKA